MVNVSVNVSVAVMRGCVKMLVTVLASELTVR